MKKITAKQAMTYVLILGLLVFLLVYFLVYQKDLEQAETIRSSNAALRVRVDELKTYYDNMGFYQEEIVRMDTQVAEWLDEFPADVKEEDIIVLAIDTERNAAIGYSNINIQGREALATIPADTVKAAQLEQYTDEITVLQRKTSYVNITDYTNLKNCIKTINDQDDRMTISNISYSGNKETGGIEGTIEVTFYAAYGTGKEYVPQVLPAYESGLYNLFGVVNVQENN